MNSSFVRREKVLPEIPTRWQAAPVFSQDSLKRENDTPPDLPATVDLREKSLNVREPAFQNNESLAALLEKYLRTPSKMDLQGTSRLPDRG